MSRLSTADAVDGGWVVCPTCREGLRAIDEALVCAECAVRYPVTSEGIPLLAAHTDESGTVEVQEYRIYVCPVQHRFMGPVRAA